MLDIVDVLIQVATHIIISSPAAFQKEEVERDMSCPKKLLVRGDIRSHNEAKVSLLRCCSHEVLQSLYCSGPSSHIRYYHAWQIYSALSTADLKE